MLLRKMSKCRLHFTHRSWISGGSFYWDISITYVQRVAKSAIFVLTKKTLSSFARQRTFIFFIIATICLFIRPRIILYYLLPPPPLLLPHFFLGESHMLTCIKLVTELKSVCFSFKGYWDGSLDFELIELHLFLSYLVFWPCSFLFLISAS